MCACAAWGCAGGLPQLEVVRNVVTSADSQGRLDAMTYSAVYLQVSSASVLDTHDNTLLLSNKTLMLNKLDI